jgi:ribulose-phosphate 3-epimerase
MQRTLSPHLEGDGGIAPHNAERGLQAGANVLVSGNAVLSVEDPPGMIGKRKAIGKEGFQNIPA